MPVITDQSQSSSQSQGSSGSSSTTPRAIKVTSQSQQNALNRLLGTLSTGKGVAGLADLFAGLPGFGSVKDLEQLGANFYGGENPEGAGVDAGLAFIQELLGGAGKPAGADPEFQEALRASIDAPIMQFVNELANNQRLRLAGNNNLTSSTGQNALAQIGVEGVRQQAQQRGAATLGERSDVRIQQNAGLQALQGLATLRPGILQGAGQLGVGSANPLVALISALISGSTSPTFSIGYESGAQQGGSGFSSGGSRTTSSVV